MIPRFSVSVSPIVPWPILIGVIATVTVLTLWAYRRRLSGTSGRWRWVALSLRLLADTPLPAGGPATDGHDSGEEEASGFVSHSCGRQQQHELQ